MASLKNDIVYGLRILRRNLGFTSLAVVILALGIATNTTVFSIMNGLLLRPLPVPDAQEITVLAFQHGNGSIGNQFSVPEYRDIASQTSGVFSGVFGCKFGIDGLSVDGRADRIATNYVTGNFFATLGITPFLGRFFVSGEGEAPGADPVLVLSYKYWRSRFNSNTSILGQKVLLDGTPVTIIGVAPKEFNGIFAFLDTQAYLPLGMLTLEGESVDFGQNRTLRNMSVGARLLRNRSVSEARAALAVVARRLAEEDPNAEKDTQLTLFPETQARPNPDPSNTALLVSCLFLGLGIILLLLVCLNVANMLLVRATFREAEMAVRTALGATRPLLIRQLLTESLLLAVIGGTAGVLLGYGINYVISNLDLHTESQVRLDFGFDWRVFTFALGAAFLTGLIVGVAPAFRVSRTDLNALLQRAGRGTPGRKHRLRSALAVAQVAGSLVLLIVGGLFLRSFKAAEHSDLGFDPSHVANISMDPGEVGYNEAQGLSFYRSVLAHVQSLQGVERAALTSSIPLGYYNDADSLDIEGYRPTQGQSQPHAMFSVVSPGYLETLRIPLVSGRTFRDSDRVDAPFVAIVNQTLAERCWPNQNPLGRTFKMGRDPKHLIEVIGVARNSRVMGVTGNMRPVFYVPIEQHYSGGLASLQTLVVRVSGNPGHALPALEAMLRDLAPNLPFFDAQPMSRAITSLNGLMIFQFGAAITGALGGLGLLLSVVGVYGVISYSVSQRRREIAIRAALGAPPTSILATIVREGLVLVGLGVVIGIAGALMASKIVGNFLVVSPTDPSTYLTVIVSLTAVALTACSLPAWRIIHTDLMSSLRYE
jgi:predicted permease